MKDIQWRAKNPQKIFWVCTDKQRSRRNHISHPHPSLHPKPANDACKSKNEPDTGNSSDSYSRDDDFIPLPGLRRCASNSSIDESESKTNDTEGYESSCFDEFSSDLEKDYQSSTKKSCPPTYTIKAGIPQHPSRVSSLGKKHGQWVVPLSLHPHDIPSIPLCRILPKAKQKHPRHTQTPTIHQPSQCSRRLMTFWLTSLLSSTQRPLWPCIMGILRLKLQTRKKVFLTHRTPAKTVGFPRKGDWKI